MNKKDTSSGQETNRRSFLKKLWGGLGIIAGLELSWIGLSFLSPRKPAGNKDENWLVAGKVGDFKPGSVFPFRNGQFYLCRFDNGGFLAISLKCTHLGCSVIWNEQEKVFNCPCHASSFDKFGDVIDPPAPKSLDALEIKFEEGLVRVKTNDPVKRKKFDHSQLYFA